MGILEHTHTIGKVTPEQGEIAGEALPCLYSNNSTEINLAAQKSPLGGPVCELSSQHRKSATALAYNVSHMVEKYGIENIGFLTLTFPDNVTDRAEAQRRMNSLKTHVLNIRYSDQIRVFERMKSGRIHYHLLVNVGKDIRTGFDFPAVTRKENPDYSSASPAIRQEWSFWRMNAKKYGFGRTELMPVASNAEAIGRYVGKYISKNVGQRRPDEDKGVRLVEYSRGARVHSTRFQFVTDNSKKWRIKVKAFANLMTEAGASLDPSTGEIELLTFENLSTYLGPKWAYHWRDLILSMPGES